MIFHTTANTKTQQQNLKHNKTTDNTIGNAQNTTEQKYNDKTKKCNSKIENTMAKPETQQWNQKHNGKAKNITTITFTRKGRNKL